jgi:hypothetical protein
MVQRTSAETYYDIKNSGLLSEKRMKVFDIFYENENGLTGSQVSEIYKNKYPTSRHSETIRNRITELYQMGVLGDLGIVECPFSGRKVTKWTCLDKLPIPLKKKLTLKEKVIDILGLVNQLGQTLEKEEDKIVLRSIYWEIKRLVPNLPETKKDAK